MDSKLIEYEKEDLLIFGDTDDEEDEPPPEPVVHEF